MFLKLSSLITRVRTGYSAKQLNALYLMHSIDSLAGGLSGIFIPIYFLTLGYKLTQVFTYFIFYSLGVMVFFVLAAYLVNNLGYKKVLLLRFPFVFLYLGGVLFLKKLNIPINLLAVIHSVDISLYWFSLHVIFGSNTNEEEMGRNVSKLYAWPQVTAIIAPIVGGTIAVFFGFYYLFIVAILFYLVSAFPLLTMSEIKTYANFKIEKLFYYIKKYKKYLLLETIENIREEMEGVVWPIYVFLFLSSIAVTGEKTGIFSVGAVSALLNASALVFTLFVGRYTDKKGKKGMLKTGMLLAIRSALSSLFNTAVPIC